jgi:hypothetical protein
MKCKYYPNALCLPDDMTKCEHVYNEHNKICPYYRVYLNSDLTIPIKIETEDNYYKSISSQIKEPIKANE